MKAMDKAFTRVDETFEAIRDSLNQQAINNIARKLAQDLRRAQQARIRSQKAPDGTAWTPRRRRVTRIQERIRFIWNNEARTLKNWHHDTGKYGRTITGWDEDKNSIRTFYRDDIDRFLEIRTRRINQDSTKRVPMFVKLRTARYLKARADAKLNQGQNFSRLMNYAMYGPKSPATNLLTEAELASMNPQELVDRIHNQNNYKHRILYYGPSSSKDLLATIDQYHQVPATLKDIPAGNEFSYLETPATKVLVAPYEAKQIYMAQISNLDKKYDPAIEPTRELYNEYFGGGMNSIVFQEMRETRGLAYSAWAGIMPPSYLKYPYTIRTQIATQNDKMIDAVNTFNDIINNMPESEAAFKLAKEGLINRMRTDRIIKSDIIWTYINAQDLGQSVDPRIKLYNDVQTMTLKDIVDFQKEWVKGRTYVYCILGDKKDLDMNKLKAVGPIEELTQEQIFGY